VFVVVVVKRYRLVLVEAPILFLGWICCNPKGRIILVLLFDCPVAEVFNEEAEEEKAAPTKRFRTASLHMIAMTMMMIEHQPQE
jgi:hypothetical protein